MSIGMWVLGIINRSRGVKFSYDYDPGTIKNQPLFKYVLKSAYYVDILTPKAVDGINKLQP